MHLSEFKAWFEGFTEEMKKPPTPTQWKKIKARVEEITADYTPATIFVDRYVYPYRHYWDTAPVWLSGLATCSNLASSDTSNATTQVAALSSYANVPKLSDWQDAGRAEFRAS